LIAIDRHKRERDQDYYFETNLTVVKRKEEKLYTRGKEVTADYKITS